MVRSVKECLQVIVTSITAQAKRVQQSDNSPGNPMECCHEGLVRHLSVARGQNVVHQDRPGCGQWRVDTRLWSESNAGHLGLNQPTDILRPDAISTLNILRQGRRQIGWAPTGVDQMRSRQRDHVTVGQCDLVKVLHTLGVTMDPTDHSTGPQLAAFVTWHDHIVDAKLVDSSPSSVRQCRQRITGEARLTAGVGGGVLHQLYTILCLIQSVNSSVHMFMKILKNSIISTPTGSWIRSRRRPHQLPAGSKLSEFFKLSWT